jgi:glycosyltransferase involved in cell wall biosynthesis
MRILCLTDFPIPKGHRWLWDYLPDGEDQVEFMFTKVEDRYQNWGKLLGYYPKLIRLASKAMNRLKEEHFDLVVAWEGKNGFPIALLRQIRRQLKPPLVILAFSIRGPLKSFGWVQRFGVRGMDYATVPTVHEKNYYTEKLNISADRIIHCPIGTHDMFDAMEDNARREIIFSGGRSGRDYDTLFKAVEGLPLRLVVNARPYNVRNLKIPDNVTVNDLKPWYEYSRLHKQAQFVVVPLLPVDESVGLTAILDGMAAGRALIVSDIPGTSEYVVHGETGLLVPNGDAKAMREAIVYLWERPKVSEMMGKRARQVYGEKYTFPLFAKRVNGILKEIASLRSQ